MVILYNRSHSLAISNTKLLVELPSNILCSLVSCYQLVSNHPSLQIEALLSVCKRCVCERYVMLISCAYVYIYCEQIYFNNV